MSITLDQIPNCILYPIGKDLAAQGDFSLRRVSKKFQRLFDEPLHASWEQLKQKAPSGPLNIPQLMERIEVQMPGQNSCCNIVLLRKLQAVFYRHGASCDTFASTPLHFAMLQIQVQNNRDKACECFVDCLWNDGVLQRHPSDSVAWMKDPQNAPVLGAVEELAVCKMELPVLPPEIARFSGLRHLSLWGNHLRSLPIEIQQLVRLKDLNLGRNKFSSLTDAIQLLPRLKSLTLEANPLKPILEKEWEVLAKNMPRIEQLLLDKDRLPKNLPNSAQRIKVGVVYLGIISWTHVPRQGAE